MSNDDFLKNSLNQFQYEAVTTIEGALLIIAGAGSGKQGCYSQNSVFAFKRHCSEGNFSLDFYQQGC